MTYFKLLHLGAIRKIAVTQQGLSRKAHRILVCRELDNLL